MHNAFQVSTVIKLSPVKHAVSSCCKSSLVRSNITQHLANFITPKARTHNLHRDELCHTHSRTKTSYSISSLNKSHGSSAWLTVLNFTTAFFFASGKITCLFKFHDSACILKLLCHRFPVFVSSLQCVWRLNVRGWRWVFFTQVNFVFNCKMF